MDGGIVEANVDWDQLTQEAVEVCLTLKWWALSLTKDPSIADDIIQDAAVNVIKHIRTFQPGTNIKAWVKQIIRNLDSTRRRNFMRAHKMSNGMVQSLTDCLEAEWIGNADHQITEDQIYVRQFLQHALGNLNKDQQELIRWFYLEKPTGRGEDKCYLEAANHFNCGVGTIKSRLWRARTILKQTMERINEPNP